MSFWQTIKSAARIGSEVLSYVSVPTAVGLLIAYNSKPDARDGLNYSIILDMSLCILNAGLHLAQRCVSNCPRNSPCDTNAVAVNRLSNLGPAIGSFVVAVIEGGPVAITLASVTGAGFGLFAVGDKTRGAPNTTRSQDHSRQEMLDAYQPQV